MKTLCRRARANADGTPVLFGQINNPRIASVEIVTSAVMFITADVAEPGFLIPLQDLSGTVWQVRFLDDAGDVVYEVEV